MNCPYRCFEISQDGVETRYAEPLHSLQDAKTFYGYSTSGPREYSFNNDVLNDMLEGTTSNVLLHQDCNDVDDPVNLMLIHGQVDEGGGKAEVDILFGESYAEILQCDDEALDYLPNVEENAAGEWSWTSTTHWLHCCTDGAAFAVEDWPMCGSPVQPIRINAAFPPKTETQCIEEWHFMSFMDWDSVSPPIYHMLAEGIEGTQTIIPQVSICEVEHPLVAPAAEVICLWPPNHKYVCFTPEVSATNICRPAEFQPSFDFVECLVNQDENDIGDGNTMNDCYYDTTTNELCMRAERQGVDKDPRKYTVTFEASDGSGMVEQVYIVPHDWRSECPGGIINVGGTVGKKNAGKGAGKKNKLRGHVMKQ